MVCSHKNMQKICAAICRSVLFASCLARSEDRLCGQRLACSMPSVSSFSCSALYRPALGRLQRQWSLEDVRKIAHGQERHLCSVAFVCIKALHWKWLSFFGGGLSCQGSMSSTTITSWALVGIPKTGFRPSGPSLRWRFCAMSSLRRMSSRTRFAEPCERPLSWAATL